MKPSVLPPDYTGSGWAAEAGPQAPAKPWDASGPGNPGENPAGKDPADAPQAPAKFWDASGPDNPGENPAGKDPADAPQPVPGEVGSTLAYYTGWALTAAIGVAAAYAAYALTCLLATLLFVGFLTGAPILFILYCLIMLVK
jgi:hypothetical protein